MSEENLTLDEMRYFYGKRNKILEYIEWLNLLEWNEYGEVVKDDDGNKVDRIFIGFVNGELRAMENLVFSINNNLPKLNLILKFVPLRRKWCLRMGSTVYWGTDEKEEFFLQR